MEWQAKIHIAEIGSFKFQEDQDANNNGVPDQLEVAKFRADTDFKNKQLKLKEKELKIKEKQANKPTGA